MNLLKAASTVSLMTLASRVTGLVRDTFMAAMFGAGAANDAFQVAFRIPNLLRRLFAEGAFSQAFVPALATARAQDGDVATGALIDAVATVLTWVLMLTCLVGVLAAPVLVYLLGSGLQQFDQAVLMTRWMFPYIGFMSLVALSAGILNTWRHFVVPAVTPVLLNVAMIAAAWLLAPRFAASGIQPIYAMVVGVLVGGVLQLAVQVPVLARLGLLPRLGVSVRALRHAWRHPGVGKVLKNMAPALLGVSVAQVSLLINTQIASQVGVGAVSWLFYADRLMEFPTGLLGVALGVVLLPPLTAAMARRDDARYGELLDWGLRLMLVLTLPCAVALLVFAEALVATLFERGAFTARDVAQTVAALRGYGVGLVGLIAIKVLAPGFYARQDIRTPVKIAVVVLVLTQIMNVLLVPQLGHAGLALSIGIAGLVNAAWLYLGLRRRGLYVPQPGWGALTLRVVVASMAMGTLLLWASNAYTWVGQGANEGQRVAWLLAVVTASIALYGALLGVMGLRLRQFMRRE